MLSAHQASEAGGELTYWEVAALRQDIVGDPAELDEIKDYTKRDAAQQAFAVREDDFARRLARCRLKTSVGWYAGAEHETTADYMGGKSTQVDTFGTLPRRLNILIDRILTIAHVPPQT